MVNLLAESCSESYLAAMTFRMQEPARPTVRTQKKCLVVSTEFCRDLSLPLVVFAE